MSTPSNAAGYFSGGGPFFGRKYELQVQLPNTSNPSQPTQLITLSSSDFGEEALKITFDIYTPAIHEAWWYAEICVYNLDLAIIDTIMSSQAQNVWVYLSAGYINGLYLPIWAGQLFQPLFERENTVDYKLTLHCLIGLGPMSTVLNQSFNSTMATQQQILAALASQAGIPLYNISKNLNTAQSPRGKTFFGSPSDVFTSIAESNRMQWWLDQKGLSLGSLVEDIAVSTAPPLIFAPPIEPFANTVGAELPPLPPGTGIIVGTPQQSMYGVNFRTLLDPRVQTKKPLMQVQINNSQIRALKRQINQYIGLLDKDNTYVVGAVRYLGNSRGQDWYCDISGYTITQGQLAMLLVGANADLNSARGGAGQ